jgi:hypothetical protein
MKTLMDILSERHMVTRLRDMARTGVVTSVALRLPSAELEGVGDVERRFGQGENLSLTWCGRLDLDGMFVWFHASRPATEEDLRACLPKPVPAVQVPGQLQPDGVAPAVQS